MRGCMLSDMRRLCSISLAACVLATGCSSVREFDVRVVNADSREPAQGVRVRAISLNSGLVPLPLNSTTIDEALSLDAVEEAASTNRDGVASLRLRTKAPYLLELSPPPMLAFESDNPAWAAPPMRFRFDTRTREITIFPPTANTRWWPYALESAR